MKSFLLRPEGLRRGPGCDSIPEPSVLVLDGVVAYAAAGPPPGAPEGTPVFSGGWLLELLADAHVHLFLSGSALVEERRRVAALSDEEALDRILRLLEEYRSAGIAAVRDGGDPRGLALQAATVANRQPERYAAVLPAGEAIYRAGAYGSFLGRGARSVEEAVGVLERNRSLGATHAKFLATGLNSLERAGEVSPGGFTDGELSELFAAARALELSPMVHANGALGTWARGLSAEATLEHGFWIRPEDRKTLSDAGAAWTPTVGAWGALERLALTEAQRAVVAATLERQRAFVLPGAKLGVELLAGSDAGTPGVEHVSGLVGELEELATAGLDSASALAASSFRARTRCEQELGRPLGGLEPGGPAGFLWLDADPGSGLAALRAPRAAFLGGRWTREDAAWSTCTRNLDAVQPRKVQ